MRARFDGNIRSLRAGLGSERNAALMPGARVVKAFNTLYCKRLASDGMTWSTRTGVAYF